MDEAPRPFRRLADEGMTKPRSASRRLTAARIEQYLYLLTLPRFVQHALHVGDLVQGVTMEVPPAFWRQDRGEAAAGDRCDQGVWLSIQEQVEDRIAGRSHR